MAFVVHRNREGVYARAEDRVLRQVCVMWLRLNRWGGKAP